MTLSSILACCFRTGLIRFLSAAPLTNWQIHGTSPCVLRASPLHLQGSRFDKYGGASNLAELNAVLKCSVMVRRLKKEVLTQLPSKRRQQVGRQAEPDAQ